MKVTTRRLSFSRVGKAFCITDMQQQNKPEDHGMPSSVEFSRESWAEAVTFPDMLPGKQRRKTCTDHMFLGLLHAIELPFPQMHISNLLSSIVLGH
ncbi:unnamed protein product [Calypogeia fissa]